MDIVDLGLFSSSNDVGRCLKDDTPLLSMVGAEIPLSFLQNALNHLFEVKGQYSHATLVLFRRICA